MKELEAQAKNSREILQYISDAITGDVTTAKKQHMDYKKRKNEKVWVHINQAVAFAEARVKEATDKLKQDLKEFYDWLEKKEAETLVEAAEDTTSEGQYADGTNSAYLVTKVRFRNKFLEEAKPTP